MKRSHFGVMLFLTGSLGYLIFSLYLSQNQYTYNGMTGTLAALLGNELLIPYLVFCAMGVIGFVICLYEAFIRKPEGYPSLPKAPSLPRCPIRRRTVLFSLQPGVPVSG